MIREQRERTLRRVLRSLRSIACVNSPQVRSYTLFGASTSVYVSSVVETRSFYASNEKCATV